MHAITSSLPPQLFQINGRRRKFHVHLSKRLIDDVRHRQVAKPFLVSRNYEPGRFLGTAKFQSILVGIGVIVPTFSFLEIVFGNFPALVWIVNPFQEAFSLFVFADVQKEL